MTAGAIAAAWAAAVGLMTLGVVVTIAWAAAPYAGNTDAGAGLKLAGAIWLAAHFAQITTSHDGVVRLAPLGLSLAAALLLYRSACWAIRSSDVRTGRDAIAIIGSVAMPYALIATVVSGLVMGPGLRPVATTSAAGALLVSLAAALCAVVRITSVGKSAIRQLSKELRAAAAAGVAGAAVVLCFGALLVALSMVSHAHRIMDLSRAYGTGWFGGLLLLVLCVLLLPNAVIWGAAFAVGPGFSFGAATVIAPGGSSVGPVPSFPLLGALPESHDLPWPALLVLAAPAVAGVVAALVWLRRAGSMTPERSAAWALGSGVLSGLMLAALAALAAGSLGDARLAHVGPDAVRVALAAAAEIGLVAGVVAWEWPRLGARLIGVRVPPMPAWVPSRLRVNLFNRRH